MNCIKRCGKSGPNSPCIICETEDIPYQILQEERCGRLLRAARDIRAGETLFSDLEGVVGPRHEESTHPTCLTCYSSLARVAYRCRGCGWPVCSLSCMQSRGPHARECSKLTAQRAR